MSHLIRNSLIAGTLALLSIGPSFAAQNVKTAPPPAPYKKVSELVKLPDFLPGIGTLYVDPKTLPDGPFLAYDHKAIADLAAPGGNVDHVSIEFNAGHRGVPEPHYHIVL
jgi:hypothetical protein